MLPFHISGMLGLSSKTHGMALVSEKGIQLVFRDAADIESKPDEEAESLLIAWRNIVSWRASRGIMSDQLTIQVQHPIGDEPDGKNDNVIELELQKKDREELDRFDRLAKEYQSGKRKDDVDDVLDDVRDLLDRM